MSIHQEVVIKGSPKAVFKILLSSKKFEEMTGGRKAKISKDEGGVASLFGGAIHARNIELVPGKRIVQAWRSADWPEGVYSIVRFELTTDGANTKLALDQVGHPADTAPHLEKGWHEMYWNPMNKMFDKA
jgi:activator of HSP90 ATPase